jgi:hypothetical protein
MRKVSPSNSFSTDTISFEGHGCQLDVASFGFNLAAKCESRDDRDAVDRHACMHKVGVGVEVIDITERIICHFVQKRSQA